MCSYCNLKTISILCVVQVSLIDNPRIKNLKLNPLFLIVKGNHYCRIKNPNLNHIFLIIKSNHRYRSNNINSPLIIINVYTHTFYYFKVSFSKKKKKRVSLPCNFNVILVKTKYIKWRSYPCEKRANLLTALGKLIRKLK